MPLRLYMDHQVPRAITGQLRSRGIDVLTAYEDGSSTLADPLLLDRATELERVLFTRDDDLLSEAARRQEEGQFFYGVIYVHQLRISVGECISDLEMLALAGEPSDVANQVTYLPL
jgi:predicted nuclease of predicted toxin-antitoxin system